MPGADREQRWVVGTEGCDVVECPAALPDDYEGGACGCLLVDVPPLSTRVLVPQARAEQLPQFPEAP
jgi:hypothetical protein